MKSLTTALTSLGLIAAMAFATPAWSVLIPMQGAVEGQQFEIALNGDGTGLVFCRECEDCVVQRFNVTPDTRAYHNQQLVDVREAQDQRGKFVTIIYNLESPGDAAQIHW